MPHQRQQLIGPKRVRTSLLVSSHKRHAGVLQTLPTVFPDLNFFQPQHCLRRGPRRNPLICIAAQFRWCHLVGFSDSRKPCFDSPGSSPDLAPIRSRTNPQNFRFDFEIASSAVAECSGENGEIFDHSCCFCNHLMTCNPVTRGSDFLVKSPRFTFAHGLFRKSWKFMSELQKAPLCWVSATETTPSTQAAEKRSGQNTWWELKCVRGTG